MRRVIYMMIAGLVSIVASAQTSIQVQTHNVVSLDEQFTVAFVVEGQSPSEFTWEPSDDFNLLWGPQQGRSSSVQIINGKRTESSQTTYSYILRPTKVGKYTLPKARAVVGGKEIFSSAASVEVVSGEESSTSNASSTSSGVQSKPKSTELTGASGEPMHKPLLSHFSWIASGANSYLTLVTSFTLYCIYNIGI